MAVSESFRTFVLEQLGRVAQRVRGRRMFGGVGVYADDRFFALIADDVLYFKVDHENRPDFEGRGMRPFQPFGEGTGTMQYYRLPDELLDDADALRPWVDKAIAVAARATARKKRPRGRT